MPGPVLAPGCLSSQAQPALAAADLILRPWLPTDASDLVDAYGDPAIHRWHCRSLSPVDAEALVAYEAHRWRQEAGGSWAVTHRGALRGRVGIGGIHLGEGRAGVTYWVLPEARGQGVATLALSGVAAWAFEAGFHRLEVDHSTQNPASCRVATKAGFAVEGTKRADALHLDGWHDMHAHALVAGDPSPGPAHGFREPQVSA